MAVYADREVVKDEDGEPTEVIYAPKWENVKDKPASFPPATHTHDAPSWSEVQSKPTSFPPETHTHDASDINSGTLPVSRGGTGHSNLAASRQAMNAVTPVGPTTVTLSSTGWSGSGPWTQQITVSGVTATDSHLHIYPVDIADAAARKLYEAAYGCLAAQADTGAGWVKFTCREKKPATNFQVVIEGGRV